MYIIKKTIKFFQTRKNTYVNSILKINLIATRNQIKKQRVEI